MQISRSHAVDNVEVLIFLDSDNTLAYVLRPRLIESRLVRRSQNVVLAWYWSCSEFFLHVWSCPKGICSSSPFLTLTHKLVGVFVFYGRWILKTKSEYLRLSDLPTLFVFCLILYHVVLNRIFVSIDDGAQVGKLSNWALSIWESLFMRLAEVAQYLPILEFGSFFCWCLKLTISHPYNRVIYIKNMRF